MSLRTVMHCFVYPLLIATGLAACGGGGGGGGGSTTVASGTFEKSYVGAPADAGPNVVMINDGFSVTSSVLQWLYRPDRVNGSGVITSVSFYLQSAVATDITCSRGIIRMGHSSLPDLTSTMPDNPDLGGFQNVFDGAFTVPASAAGTAVTFTLDTPFVYNGVDSLIMEYERAENCTADANMVQYVNTGYGSTMYPGLASALPRLYQSTFHFQGGDNLVVDGTTEYLAPFRATLADVRHLQTIYLADEINGAGPVTGIALKLGATTTVDRLIQYSVTLSHTSLSAVASTTFADNVTGSSEAVALSRAVTISGGMPADTWFWLPIPDGLFTYNGTDNLVLDISVTAAGGDVSLRAKSQATARTVYGVPGMDVGSGGSGYTPALKLRFNGAPTHVMPVKTTDESFDITSGSIPLAAKTQVLASELGSKGTITSIACRLDNDASLGTYQNLTVKMSHAASIGTPEVVTVRDGLFTLNAGVPAGNWLEIPLTTPFEYDGFSDLNILLAWSHATGILTCDAGGNSTLYAGRSLTLPNTGGVVVPTLYNLLPALKLGISR